MIRRIALIFALGLCMTTRTLAQVPESDWCFSLEGSYLYGQVNGYVQTPSGGEPGTTNSKRPTLSEIGIDNASIIDAQITGAYHNEQLYLGGQYIHMTGSANLDQSLITNGVAFPAGADVNSQVDLNWYRFGYQHRFQLGDNNEWTLTPGVGAAVLDFSYKLHSDAESASRSYIKINAQFGLDTQWRPRGGPFSLNLRLLGTVPVSGLPQMFVEQFVADYRLFDKSNTTLSAFAGVAFEQINFEDNQTVSNHIQADFGPMFVVGFNFSF